MLAVTALLTLAAPEQVHLAYNDGGAMWVSWLDTAKYGGVVRIKNGKTYKAQASTYDYQAKKMSYVYTSPNIYHTLVDGLTCGNKYSYTVCAGSKEGDCGPARTFKVPHCAGPDVPTSVAFMGDLGQTSNSNDTVKSVMQGAYDFALIVGDLSYSDPSSYKKGSHEPERWDSWGRMMEQLTSVVPLQTLPGNHELENSPKPKIGEDFVAFNSRMKGVSTSAPDGPQYWSFGSGNVHTIALNSYIDYSATSAQYVFLEAELKKVDRSVTPWLVVCFHSPWYNSNKHHHNEAEELQMMAIMEPLLEKFDADLLVSGHVHAYERSYNVYNNHTHGNGHIAITIGDGGNREVLEPDCWRMPQPEWSAFRLDAYGHGRLQTFNATHAQWSWHQQGHNYHNVTDSVWLVKPTPDSVTAVPSAIEFSFPWRQ